MKPSIFSTSFKVLITVLLLLSVLFNPQIITKPDVSCNRNLVCRFFLDFLRQKALVFYPFPKETAPQPNHHGRATGVSIICRTL